MTLPHGFLLTWHINEQGEALAELDITRRELRTVDVARLAWELHVTLGEMRMHEAQYLYAVPDGACVTRPRYHLLRKAEQARESCSALCGATPASLSQQSPKWRIVEPLVWGTQPLTQVTCGGCQSVLEQETQTQEARLRQGEPVE